jgi:small subunit ribosomal protein S9
MPQTSIHGRTYGTGKRKNAIARVFMKAGEGSIKVNGRTLEDYFPRETSRMIIQQPFDTIEQPNKYDIEVNVSGGGTAAQAEAIRHGISRALLLLGDHRGALKKAGFLTRDARKKERKKPGQPGARKRFQYSKR